MNMSLWDLRLQQRSSSFIYTSPVVPATRGKHIRQLTHSCLWYLEMSSLNYEEVLGKKLMVKILIKVPLEWSFKFRETFLHMLENALTFWKSSVMYVYTCPLTPPPPPNHVSPWRTLFEGLGSGCGSHWPLFSTGTLCEGLGSDLKVWKSLALIPYREPYLRALGSQSWGVEVTYLYSLWRTLFEGFMFRYWSCDCHLTYVSFENPIWGVEVTCLNFLLENPIWRVGV